MVRTLCVYNVYIIFQITPTDSDGREKGSIIISDCTFTKGLYYTARREDSSKGISAHCTAGVSIVEALTRAHARAHAHAHTAHRFFLFLVGGSLPPVLSHLLPGRVHGLVVKSETKESAWLARAAAAGQRAARNRLCREWSLLAVTA